MVFGWFDASEVVAFAEEIVLEIEKLFPLDELHSKSRNTKKELKRLNSLLVRVRSFAMKAPLNVYKKAKFLNTIKWRLHDARRDQKFISDVVALFTTSLNA